MTPRAKDKKKNPFAAFFSKEKTKDKPEKIKSSAEVDKENTEDMFDMLDRVQRSRLFYSCHDFSTNNILE